MITGDCKTMSLNDAISVVESVAGFTDESTLVGEAWEVILAALKRTEKEVVGPTRRELLELASVEIDGLNRLCLPDGSATDITDELESFANSVLSRWGK